MKFLTFAGSLQEASLNKKIAKLADQYLRTQLKLDSSFIDLKQFEIPVYDGDIEKSSGLPAGVEKLASLISQHQALIISTPEYNGSIPGVLKNTLDWLSRKKPQPLKGKHVLLLAASPGAMGGIRALWHTRVPFEVLGCHVYPEVTAIGKANEILNNDHGFKDEKTKENVERVLKEFSSFVSKNAQ